MSRHDCHDKASLDVTLVTPVVSPTKLDTVLTVAIGRIMADGVELDARDWADFRFNVDASITTFGTVVAYALGGGLTSDQGDATLEDTAVWVVVNVSDPDSLRASLSWRLRDYGASSACFAFDGAHEPVFPTLDGRRADSFAHETSEGNPPFPETTYASLSTPSSAAS